MKNYLNVIVTSRHGHQSSNPLKLSESYMISKLGRENKEVKVVYTECSKEYYKSIFG